jgi:membrane protease YdiL (CAAX protease family)
VMGDHFHSFISSFTDASIRRAVGNASRDHERTKSGSCLSMGRSRRRWWSSIRRLIVVVTLLLCWYSVYPVAGFSSAGRQSSPCIIGARKGRSSSVARHRLPLPTHYDDGRICCPSRGRKRRRPSDLIPLHASKKEKGEYSVERWQKLYWYTSPPIQWITLLAVYAFHLTVLSRRGGISIGDTTVVGYDAIVGGGVFAALLLLSRLSVVVGRLWWPWQKVPPGQRRWRATAPQPPWHLPSTNHVRFRLSTVAALVALFYAYLQTGKFSLYWEDFLLELSYGGWPITEWSYRALQIILSHLTWTSAVVSILAVLPFPTVFRPQRYRRRRKSRVDEGGLYDEEEDDENDSDTSLITPKPAFATLLEDDDDGPKTKTYKYKDEKYYWYTWKSRHWLHWATAGFVASHFVFAVADTLNHYLLPNMVFSHPSLYNPSIVSQLVVGPDRATNWLGCIAPCLTAPFLEELLYRGFVWPAVTTLLGGNAVWANIVQAVVFSAHHVSTTGAIPLAALGLFWAWLYQTSGSLATVIAVHVMWNARVFCSAWFLGV